MSCNIPHGMLAELGSDAELQYVSDGSAQHLELNGMHDICTCTLFGTLQHA